MPVRLLVLGMLRTSRAIVYGVPMSADDLASDVDVVSPFDFDSHRLVAVEAYRQKRGNYEDLARAVQSLLTAALSGIDLKVQSIDQRAKSEESFGLKAARPAGAEGATPKYADPLREIQDMAGCRVITFFLHDVQKVRDVIQSEFDVIEMVNRSSQLSATGRPGYESYHFVVGISESRLRLPEYARFRDMVAEIQVRTILQHAWAEIEHDIQYKSVDALPAQIGQRFRALAGLIEIGDREFQAIADAHESVRQAAAVSLESGDLLEIELTADSLKAYLDKTLGPDGRIRDWAYEWTAAYLRKAGFANLQQVDEVIDGYDDDNLSRLVWGGRQGQLSRFELMLLAGLGAEKMKAIHPYADEDWFRRSIDREIGIFREAGISSNDGGE